MFLTPIGFFTKTPPSTPSWFSGQPVSGSTSYTPQVAFNKTIASVGNITSSGTNQPTNFSYPSGRVQFDITTDPNPSVTYTFHNIIAVDGGRLASATLTTGPSVTGYLSNNNADVTNKVLIQAAAQSFSVTFSKTISNQPSATMAAGTATYVSGQGSNTIVYDLTNVTGSSVSLNFGSVIATDTTSSSGLSVALAPVTAETFNRVAEQSAPLISKTTFDQNTTYNLLGVFNKDISNNLSGVTITASSGSNPTALAYSSADRYSFDWTPDVTGNVTLAFNNMRDVDGFIYTALYTSLLTVNAIILPILYIDASVQSLFTTSGTTVTGVNGSSSVNGFTSPTAFSNLTYDPADVSGNGLRLLKCATNSYIDVLFGSTLDVLNQGFTHIIHFCLGTTPNVSLGYYSVYYRPSESIGDGWGHSSFDNMYVVPDNQGTRIVWGRPQFTTNQWYTIALKVNNLRHVSFYINGTLYAPPIISVVSSSFERIRLFNYWNGGGGNNWLIAETEIVPTNLSVAQIDAKRTAFLSKWGSPRVV